MDLCCLFRYELSALISISRLFSIGAINARKCSIITQVSCKVDCTFLTHVFIYAFIFFLSLTRLPCGGISLGISDVLYISWKVFEIQFFSKTCKIFSMLYLPFYPLLMANHILYSSTHCNSLCRVRKSDLHIHGLEEGTSIAS